MRKTQQGFTLIELIMVIVIIGILASVALPRFYDMQTDARSAKAEAVYGAVRSASSIVHSAALVKGLTSGTVAAPTTCPSNAGICMEGMGIALTYGYPSVGSIASAANVVAADGYDLTTAGTILIDSKVNCSVVYAAPTAAGGTPTITLKNNRSTPAGDCS